MTMFRRLALSALVLIAVAAPLQAQTILNSTTLSAAITDTSSQIISLTSTSTVAVGDWLFVEREAMKVQSLSPLTVTRGAIAAKHGAGSVVYTGPATRFYESTPRVGGCVRSEQRYLPHIVLSTGEVYDCPLSANVWALMNDPAQIVVTCRTVLVAESIDQSCFTADRPYVVTKITEVHKTPEAGGTVTLIPRKQVGTQAPASGAALATAVSELVAAETVQTFVLTTTTASLLLAAGDRLGLDFTDDTPGELAGVTVTFTLSPR